MSQPLPLDISNPTEFPQGRRARALSDPYDGEHWRHHLYRPLNAGRKEIRVLEVRPSRNVEADPDCKFHILALADPPIAPFAALSYAWGDSLDKGWVYLDGYRVRVLRTVCEALRNLRSTRVPGMMWIDSICINQRDLKVRLRF